MRLRTPLNTLTGSVPLGMRRTLIVLLLVGVGACGDDTATTTSGVASTTSAEPTATVAPTTTTTAPTSTTTEPTSTITEPVTTVALPVFPHERLELTHGGDAWVVVLAAAEYYDDPAIEAAVAVADSFGFHTGATDCDVGASEALGVPEGVTVSVYFESEADAQAALLAFQARGVDGVVALVRTFCMD